MNSTTDPPGEAELPVPGYRKSSGSVNNGQCAEVGSTPSAVLVRDTADRSGPVIAFTAEAWARFTSGMGR